MRAHLTNSLWSVVDYLAQPAGMLLAAPILLHHLGLAPYGLWLIASAAVSAGSIVSSGFGDAVLQRIASLRAVDDLPAIRRVVATMLSLNLLLGTALTALVWPLLPTLVQHIVHTDPTLSIPCLWSLRIGLLLIVVKSVESVFLSAQRAFSHYAPAVRIGVATRLTTIALTLALALRGHGIVALMLGTAAVTIAGAATQSLALQRHLGPGLILPGFHRTTALQLASFGGYTWLQALSGVIFGQADRLLLGTLLGASAVAVYGTAVQLAQPIHGLTAAALHFLFPHLAARFATGSGLRGPVLKALAVNLLSATVLTATVLVLGPRVLALWMGHPFAASAATLLPLIALSFGILALNITAHYTLMAQGRVRLVSLVNLIGGILMLLAMTALIPTHGLQGAALARLLYGPATLLLYVPLLPLLLPAGNPTWRQA